MPFNNRNDRRRSPDVERIPARDRLSRPDRVSNFRSLCIKGGWPRGVKDHVIIETIEKVFRKFDEHNVKLAMVAGEKICYINFTQENDARVALEKMRKVHVFDRSLPLEPVIKGVLPVDPRDRDRKRSKSRSPSQRYKEGPKSAVVTKRDGSRHRSPEAPVHSNRGDFDNYNSRSEREVYYEPRKPKVESVDPPSRMLFVSDLDPNLNEQDLYAEFQRYASVMSIDMKYPRDGPAFACIAFLNPDEAEKGKKGMQGKQIGGRSSKPCKITYGSSPESSCIWVGGLGKQTSLAALENEFDRFGDIKKIDYSKGENFAYIVYSSSEGAKTAIKALTGRHICGSDSRARFDYVEYDQVSAMNYHMRITKTNAAAKAAPSLGEEVSPPMSRAPPGRDSRGDGGYRDEYSSGSGRNTGRYDHDNAGGKRGYSGKGHPNETRERSPHRDSYSRKEDKSGGGGNFSSSNRGKYDNDRDRNYNGTSSFHGKGDHRDRSRSPPYGRSNRRSPENEFRADKKRSRAGSFDRRTGKGGYEKKDDEPRNKRHRSPSPMSIARESLDITSLAMVLESCWKGHLILKNSAFSTHMSLLSGSREVCKKLLIESPTGDPATALKITQRLRCEPGKLEEVRRRMESATSDGFCLLLATQNNDNSGGKELPSQTAPRQFKNLVSYLKSKHSAGVIGLPIGSSENMGVLHAFPPCKFFTEDLKKVAPKIIDAEALEDHLIIVILSGVA